MRLKKKEDGISVEWEKKERKSERGDERREEGKGRSMNKPGRRRRRIEDEERRRIEN